MTAVRNREIDAAVGDLEFDPYALKRKYEEERDRRVVPEGHGQYVPAIEGKFGDAQFTERTAASELFINPLMAIYFAFELAAVARQSLYLHLLEDTESIFDVGARIRAFRSTLHTRPRVPIPH